MPDFIPYQIMRSYTHMASADTVVWERFIRANPTYFDAVAYDVQVGSGPGFDTVVNPETGGDLEALYKKKIDVLGVKDGVHIIVEVKPRADSRAIGQVEGYRDLALRDLPGLKGPKMLIVCESIVPDVDYLAQKKGIALVIV